MQQKLPKLNRLWYNLTKKISFIAFGISFPQKYGFGTNLDFLDPPVKSFITLTTGHVQPGADGAPFRL